MSPALIDQQTTIAGVAQSLIRALRGRQVEEELHSQFQEIELLRETWISKIQSLQSSRRPKSRRERATVLLVGSTGSFGPYILNCLILDPGVEAVVCLNRLGNDQVKQQKTHQDRGLSLDFSKVNFLQTDDSGLESFNHGEIGYRDIANRATHIVHNAWPVNFNLPLHSFTPQLATCFRLIELAKNSANEVTITFLSSIGAAANWNKQGLKVPETRLTDLSVAEHMGYAQSKLLAELLFVAAHEHLKLSTNICRIEQIAGPVTLTTGAWNPHEWFPSLLQSSQRIGKIPETLGSANRVNWIPVDKLASILCEATVSNDSETASVDAFAVGGQNRVMHFVNPQVIAWSKLVRDAVDALDGGVSVVEYEHWLQSILDSDDLLVDNMKTMGASCIPAKKIIGFFERIGTHGLEVPKFETAEAERASRSLRTLSPVSDLWLRCWVKQLRKRRWLT